MEAKIAPQAEATSVVVGMHPANQSAITKIAELFQLQMVFNENTKKLIVGLVQEIQKHQERFQEVVRVLKNHEQHIVGNGVSSQEMAQYINALIQENRDKTLRIASMMNETQAHSQVLRQHNDGQQVLAGVVKQMFQQRPSQP